MKCDLIIIGAGPAGLTAGLYACRAKWRACCLERLSPGGQAGLTAKVENYPGFEEPLSGLELARKMEAQARRFGLEIVLDEAKSIQVTESEVSVVGGAGAYAARAAIVASGARARELGVPGEKELRGKGVSYCATCDGPFFRDQAVAVVGGGDSALEEAIFLARLCRKVYLVHRREEFRAVGVLVERIAKEKKIVPVTGSVLERVVGDEAVTGIQVKNVKSGEAEKLDVSGVFLYVGLVPNSELVRDVVHVDGDGYIVTDQDMRTSGRGIFAAGDVRQKGLRQIATAVGDGAVAGMSAVRYLKNLGET
jgi:thioredoxin reductase (NADPH)